MTSIGIVQTSLWSLDALVTPGGVMTFIRLAARKSGISTGQMHLHVTKEDLTLTYFFLYAMTRNAINITMYTYSHITSCINPRQISGTWPSTFAVILESLADWLSFQNSKYNNTSFGKYGYSQSSNKTWLYCEITHKNRKSERNTVRKCENLFFLK